MTTGGFTLGGKSARELGLIMLRSSKRPGLPQTKDRTLAIPGRHGEYDFGADLAPRVFELDCAFNTRNAYLLQQSVRDLALHLLDASGRPRTMDLILDMAPDLAYTVRLTGDLPVDRASGLGRFTLRLTAFDPIAVLRFEPDSITVDSELSVDSGISIDSPPYEFGFSGPATVSVENFGDLQVSPVIEVIGSFSSLTLTVEGHTFTYSAAFSGATPLIVDGSSYTARIGAVNVLGNTTGSFIILPPGISSVQIGGTGLNCTVSFRFRPQFL